MPSISLFDEGPQEPCPSPFNLAAYVLAQADRLPDKIALEILGRIDSERWTYREIKRAVLGIAAGLSESGLKAGDILLLRIGNTVEFPLMFLGAIAGGFVPVPTSSQLTEPEIRDLIDDLKPSCVVFGKGITQLNDLPCQVISPKEITDLCDHAPGNFVFGDPSRLAYIIYTSGTSGRPRAVQHAHRAIWARRMMWQGWYDLHEGDRMFHAGAFNWTYTLGTGINDPWSIGATALIPAPDIPSSDLFSYIKSSKATIFAAAPGVYRQMLKPGNPPALPALRHGLSAGEKLPPSVAQAWRDATGTEVYEALGMSEISTFISSSPTNPPHEDASGRPQKGRRVAVIDHESLAVAPLQAIGILAVSKRDHGLMLGYRNAPDETAAKFSGEWFLTGDTVSMDRHGYITYHGRNDDMMNAGGYRVSPIEVETILNHHPHIQETAAIAVEIKADTFVIAALYVSDIELDDEELAAYCRKQLARYKCPRLFRRLDALPKGANNKLLRGVLRDKFKEMP